MKLIIKRITSILYQTDSLLELDLDPLSLSGSITGARKLTRLVIQFISNLGADTLKSSLYLFFLTSIVNILYCHN
jgi:hypothetical protein